MIFINHALGNDIEIETYLAHTTEKLWLYVRDLYIVCNVLNYWIKLHTSCVIEIQCKIYATNLSIFTSFHYGDCMILINHALNNEIEIEAYLAHTTEKLWWYVSDLYIICNVINYYKLMIDIHIPSTLVYILQWIA